MPRNSRNKHQYAQTNGKSSQKQSLKGTTNTQSPATPTRTPTNGAEQTTSRLTPRSPGAPTYAAVTAGHTPVQATEQSPYYKEFLELSARDKPAMPHSNTQEHALFGQITPPRTSHQDAHAGELDTVESTTAQLFGLTGFDPNSTGSEKGLDPDAPAFVPGGDSDTSETKLQDIPGSERHMHEYQTNTIPASQKQATSEQGTTRASSSPTQLDPSQTSSDEEKSQSYFQQLVSFLTYVAQLIIDFSQWAYHSVWPETASPDQTGQPISSAYLSTSQARSDTSTADTTKVSQLYGQVKERVMDLFNR